MPLFIRFIVFFCIAAGSVFVGWLLQFLWGFLVSFLPVSPRRRPLKQAVCVWIVRAVYISVLMAAIDCCSGYYFRHGVFSMTWYGLKDGGTTMSVGPGYCMTFWRRMDGEAYGPEIWFWFTPFRVDMAHRNFQIHWLSKRTH
jgi:hypothetical protein